MSNIIKSLSETNKIVGSSLVRSNCPVVLYLLQQGKSFVSPVQLAESNETFTVTGGITSGQMYQPDGVKEPIVARESVILLGENGFTTARYLSCDKGDCVHFVKHPTRDFYVLAVKGAEKEVKQGNKV